MLERPNRLDGNSGGVREGGEQVHHRHHLSHRGPGLQDAGPPHHRRHPDPALEGLSLLALQWLIVRAECVVATEDINDLA